MAAQRQRGIIINNVVATAVAIARRRRWQYGSRAAVAGSAAAAAGSAAMAAGSVAAAQIWRTSAATAVLPTCAAAVAIKTPATTAMAGAQTTINNQLKAATATATETTMMTATTTVPIRHYVDKEGSHIYNCWPAR